MIVPWVTGAQAIVVVFCVLGHDSALVRLYWAGGQPGLVTIMIVIVSLQEAYVQAREQYGDTDIAKSMADIIIHMLHKMIEDGLISDDEVDEICDWLCE